MCVVVGVSIFRLSAFKVTVIVIVIVVYVSLSSATRPFALFRSGVSETGTSSFSMGEEKNVRRR
jgi:hypothetical protein